MRTIDPKEITIRDAAFRPDGTRLAVAGDSGRATIWSVPGWEPVQSLRVGEQNRNALSIQPRRQIPGDAGFELDQDLGRGNRRVPLPDPRCRLRPGLHSGWSEDRGGGRRGHGAILGCQAGARRSRPYRKGESLQRFFQPDGRRIIDAVGTVLDAATGAVVRTIPAPSGQTIRETALYPDGHRAVVFRYTGPPPYTKPGELVLWDIDAGRELKKLDGVPFGSLAVSPDGRWLMSQNHHDGDETWSQSDLIVRDAATWEPVLTRRNPPLFGRRCVHEGFERGRRG